MSGMMGQQPLQHQQKSSDLALESKSSLLNHPDVTLPKGHTDIIV